MRTLYLDLFSGISGDMFIGALLDLGVDAAKLQQELARLGAPGYHLHIGRARRQGIEGVKFDVHIGSHAHAHLHEYDNEDHDHEHDKSHSHGHEHEHGHYHAHEDEHEHSHPHSHEHTHAHEHTHQHGSDVPANHAHRTFADIRQLITASALSAWAKQHAIAVFARIAAAEGHIHGLPPENVGFHEVGALDSIVDICGACIALELLDKPRVIASTVTEGTGWIDCAHGRFPVPAPATLAILAERGIPVTQCDERNELVTPTGAALLAEFSESFGGMHNLKPLKIGFGIGTRENKTRPNVLRAILGETQSGPAAHDWDMDTVAVLETNLDDISSEVLGAFMEKTLSAGALDVFHTAIQMKKNRPGVLVSVLCAEADADRFSEMILRETSAFGVRRTLAERRKLAREFTTVRTIYGDVTLKIGRLDGAVLHRSPEFESCRKLAESAGVPVQAVYHAAIRAALSTP
jgi:uncharacterized protein (TIGR00299 family) protein